MKTQLSSKNIFDKFMLALRNYELYPEHHVVTQNSVTECMEQLAGFLEANGTFSLKINREQMMYEEEVVYQAPPGDENPAFILYRDGIETLEFHQGITRDEFTKFLKILRRHSISKRHDESDIVTELWESDFTGIRYETTDVFWKDEPLIDFAHVRVIEPSTVEETGMHPEQTIVPGASETVEKAVLFELSDEEIKYTKEMVKEEELRNFDVDLFDVLLIILKEQREADDFAMVLDIIRESVQNTIERAEFNSVARFFKNIKSLHNDYKKTNFWAIPHIEDFLLMISSNKVLSSLHKAWPNIDINDDAQLSSMRMALSELYPQAIYTLCPMVLEVPAAKIQMELIESIKMLAKQDVKPLIKLLYHPDEKLSQNAVFILGHIPGKNETNALVKLLNDTSGTLRFEVVKSLSKREPVLTKTLFPLIDDPDPDIRKLVVERLGKERNALTEKLLINYIVRGKFKKGDSTFLMQLYRALGGCGASAAIPLLKHKALKRSLVFGRAVTAMHREGALLALRKLGTTESEKLVNRLSKINIH